MITPTTTTRVIDRRVLRTPAVMPLLNGKLLISQARAGGPAFRSAWTAKLAQTAGRLWPCHSLCRSSEAPLSPMPTGSERSPTTSRALDAPVTKSWSSSRRWERRPTTSSGSSNDVSSVHPGRELTCCCRPASASRWPSSRWHWPISASPRHRSPGVRPASSPTPPTRRRGSSRSDRDRLVEALESGVVPIVAGFQGVSVARDVTTLGRGGSDTHRRRV